MATSGCSTELNQLQQLSGCPDDREELLFIAPSGFSGYSGYGLRTWGDLLDCGLSGFSGYSGFSGHSGFGSSGVSGFSGDSGLSGYSGSGHSGYSGYSGYSGFSGHSGIGTSGFSGYSGDNPGSSGFSGFSGLSGQAGGESGTSGYSGRSGYSGFSGKSGYSGFSGVSGFSGDNPGSSGFSGFSGGGLQGWQDTLDVNSVLNRNNAVNGVSLFTFKWDNLKHFINAIPNGDPNIDARLNIGMSLLSPNGSQGLRITNERIPSSVFRIYDDSTFGSGGNNATNIRLTDLNGNTILLVSGIQTTFGNTVGGAVPTMIRNTGVVVNDGGVQSLGMGNTGIASNNGKTWFLSSGLNVLQTIAPNGVTIGSSTTPIGSAVLMLDSTTRGFLPPRMTTAQRDIIFPASATVNVVDYTQLAGKTLTVAGHVLTEGVNWTAATSNSLTANSLGAAIDALSEVSAQFGGGFSSIVITASVAGTAGNSITLATSDAVNLTISGALLSGGVNAVAGLVIYNTSTNKLNLYNGSAWEQVTSA